MSVSTVHQADADTPNGQPLVCLRCGLSSTELGLGAQWSYQTEYATCRGEKAIPGVWVAFNWDGSAFVPFATELEALRHANSYHMPVKFVEFGDEEWMRK